MVVPQNGWWFKMGNPIKFCFSMNVLSFFSLCASPLRDRFREKRALPVNSLAAKKVASTRGVPAPCESFGWWECFLAAKSLNDVQMGCILEHWSIVRFRLLKSPKLRDGRGLKPLDYIALVLSLDEFWKFLTSLHRDFGALVWHECMSLKLMLLNCYYMLFVLVSQAWTWSSALSGTATAFKTFKLHCDHLRHLSSCRDDGWIMLDQPSCYSLQAACSRHSRLTSPDNLMRIGMNRVRPACTSGSPFAMKHMKYMK